MGVEAAIMAKLARAQRQLGRVEVNGAAFIERGPYAAVGEFNAERTEYLIRLKVFESPPLDWAIRVGEAVHQMRSALDHTVHALVVDNGGVPTKRTGFPVHIDRHSYRSNAAAQIDGVGPGVRAIIKSMQPYHAAEPENTLLWGLNELWNKEKHRSVSLAIGLGHASEVVVTDNTVGTHVVRKVLGAAEHEAEIARVVFAVPQPSEVKVNSEFVFLVALDDGAATDPGGEPTSMTRTLVEVRQIVRNLLMRIGHP